MGYYRGDYRPGYYRGDIFGDILGGVTGAIGGFLTGGPVGAILGGVTGVAKAVAGSRGAAVPNIVPPVFNPRASMPGGAVPYRGGLMNLGGGSVPLQVPGQGSFIGVRAGGPTGFQIGYQGPSAGSATFSGYGGGGGGGGSCPTKSGRPGHPNKSTYITRDGTLHTPGSTCVPRRRLNVGNARALRRALRRARGFAKLAHKVLRATHQFKGKGFGRSRARRR